MESGTEGTDPPPSLQKKDSSIFLFLVERIADHYLQYLQYLQYPGTPSPPPVPKGAPSRRDSGSAAPAPSP